MGKRLIQQRRGRSKTKFNAPSHRFRGNITYSRDNTLTDGTVEDIIHDPGRTAPLAIVKFNGNKKIKVLASEGTKIGDTVKISDNRYDAKKVRIDRL